MKALRILGIVFAIVLVLVAAALGALYALFDGEKIKGELTRVVMEQKQRKLDIAGKLELSVWPDVGIKLGRLTLSEPGGKEEFLALDSARVEVAVMPLLSRQVKVQRIEVNGLKATLVKHKDGTLNIADLMGGAADKEGSAKTAPKVGADGTASAPVQIDIAGIKVANAQLTWRDEKSKETTSLSNLDLGSGRVQADSARQTLAVDALTLAAKGKTGTDNFELKLEAPRLNISPDKSSGETLNLTANLAGSGRSLIAKLVLSGVEGNAKALKIGKLVLDLDAKAGESTLKGHLDSPVAADIAAQTVALEKLAGSIDLANPQMPMKQLKLPLSGSLRADLAKQSAALDLGTRFDESKIDLKLRVAKFAPLALGFDLDIDTLNVDKYLPPKPAQEKNAAAPDAAGKAAPQGKEGAGAKETEGKLDFSALKGHDVNGALRIGALQVSKLKLAKLNAKIRLAGGRLDVAPLTMNLYEGSTSGSLSLNAAGNQVGLKQNLTGISINPLMKDLADKDLLEGRGNVALAVTSQGDSVTAMKKALGGTASLNLKDGAIKGINLAQSMRDVKDKLGALQGKPEGTTQKAKSSEKTDFSELSASLKIANGVAHNDDLAMKSPFLRLSGAGDIDIGAGQMNYLAKATAVSSSAGQGGKEVDKLKGVTVPVRVTGPFDALSYKLELGDLAADMAKSKLEEKAGAITGKSDSKLKDKLKGLFSK
ncbi:MAG: AsmA family protein [Betaproteobacteria bacterium]|nr:AsmA family protein [Betaproteobacteria bacterium]